jgi:UDPglucose--hexose-1-phosphate uridylyltransferase
VIIVSQLRLNPLTGRWVTLVADRAKRPTDFAPRQLQVESDPSRPCPFCPGNEEATPPALEQVDSEGRWTLRVVPNLYPAFDGMGALTVRNLGPVHTMADASGIHEVFVITPDHTARVGTFTDEVIRDVMTALKRRFEEHARTPNVRYTQAFINHGREAGASLSHPHGQILGLPFVPGEILDEERAFDRFKGGCILCATIEAERVDNKRVVIDNEHAMVICPYWSGGPYELLIVPKSHDVHITDTTDEMITGVGIAIRDSLAKLYATLGDVAYNLVFHTAPSHHAGGFHWHAHLWPKLTTTAGFERGTGVLINIVPPEDAAFELNNAGK